MPEPIIVPPVVSDTVRHALAERDRRQGLPGMTRQAALVAAELAAAPVTTPDVVRSVAAWHQANPHATTAEGRSTLLAGVWGGRAGRDWSLAMAQTLFVADETARRAAAATGPVAAGIAVVAADTGRVLMLQRALDPTGEDEHAGKWEFPGGKLDDGEGAYEAAQREFCEEARIPVPGKLAGDWHSDDGVYHGFIHVVPTEKDVTLNVDHEDRHVSNPDDPDGDNVEVVAWWSPGDADGNPVVRREVLDHTPWGELANVARARQAAAGHDGRAGRDADSDGIYDEKGKAKGRFAVRDGEVRVDRLSRHMVQNLQHEDVWPDAEAMEELGEVRVVGTKLYGTPEALDFLAGNIEDALTDDIAGTWIHKLKGSRRDSFEATAMHIRKALAGAKTAAIADPLPILGREDSRGNSATARHRKRQRLRRTNRKLAKVDRDLRKQLRAGAEVAMADGLRRAGVKVTQRAAKRSKAVQAAVSDCETGGVGYPPALLAAAGITEQEALAHAFDAFSQRADRWIADAQRRKAEILQRDLGVDASVLERHKRRWDLAKAAAVTFLVGSLTRLAFRRLTGQHPLDTEGEGGGGILVPEGVIGDTIAIGDGKPYSGDGLAGDAVVDKWAPGVTFEVITDSGIHLGVIVGPGEAPQLVERIVWRWNDSERPFEPHLDLDGSEATADTVATVWAKDPDEFPYGTRWWFPGDHAGCQCSWDSTFEVAGSGTDAGSVAAAVSPPE